MLVVGNAALLAEYGSPSPRSPADPGTIVYIGELANGGITQLGFISFSDAIKPDAKAAIAELHRMKLRTVLLTGDTAASAEAVALALGIGQIQALAPAGENAGGQPPSPPKGRGSRRAEP